MTEEITKKEALHILLDQINVSFPEIALEAREAVNEGKDVERVDTIFDESGRKKQRKFRERIPLADEEALIKVIDVLGSYFVELPMAINSAYEEFSACQIDASHREQFELGRQGNISLAFELGGVGEFIRNDDQLQRVVEKIPSDQIEFASVKLRQLRNILAIRDEE